MTSASPGAQLLAAHAVYAWNRPLAVATMERLIGDDRVDPVVREYAVNVREDLRKEFEGPER